jgi:hypothetical protein
MCASFPSIWSETRDQEFDSCFGGTDTDDVPHLFLAVGGSGLAGVLDSPVMSHCFDAHGVMLRFHGLCVVQPVWSRSRFSSGWQCLGLPCTELFLETLLYRYCMNTFLQLNTLMNLDSERRVQSTPLQAIVSFP